MAVVTLLHFGRQFLSEIMVHQALRLMSAHLTGDEDGSSRRVPSPWSLKKTLEGRLSIISFIHNLSDLKYTTVRGSEDSVEVHEVEDDVV